MLTESGQTEDLDGLSVERAADVVDTEERSGEVRETLAVVARDGVVRRAAVDDAVANASMVVATAETRAELAGDGLESARETAGPVSDLDIVSTRIEAFDERLVAVEDRADDLGDAVREVLDAKGDGDLYAIARQIKRVTSAATEVQRAADDLQFELDSFEEWLTDADRRAEELAADVDALAESVDDLGDAVDALAADDGPEAETGRAWAAATARHRVVSLMIVDLRAELETLRTWAEREGEAPPSGVEPRLGDVRAANEAVGTRLTALAEPEWTARFGDRLTAVDEALGAMEPPVSWGEVEAVVEDRVPAVER